MTDTHHERKAWPVGGLQIAIVERYPGGVVPWGISQSLGAEFGVSRSTASHAIRELGFSVERPSSLRHALIARFPSGSVTSEERRALRTEFSVTRQRVSQVLKELGLKGGKPGGLGGSPVREAIAARYPAGAVPHGVSIPIAKEFSVSQARVSKAIRELGFKVEPRQR